MKKLLYLFGLAAALSLAGCDLSGPQLRIGTIDRLEVCSDFIDDFDKEFISKHEDRIVGDERTFESGLDGGLMPTSESITRDFNRIFGTNYKNIVK